MESKNKNKAIISVVAGAVLIAVSFFVYRSFTKKDIKQKATNTMKIVTPTINVYKAQPTSQSVELTRTGRVKSGKRLTLYSVVTGVTLPTRTKITEGAIFRRGEAIIRVDQEEVLLSLYAKKSNFKMVLVKMLPAFHAEYPDNASNWKAYVDSFEVKKPIPPLPKTISEQEGYFVTGSSIEKEYYTIRNIETSLRNYTVYAPFRAAVISGELEAGSLVATGQKIGEAISLDHLEFQTSVPIAYSHLAKKGIKVLLRSSVGSKTYQGTIKRVASSVNPEQEAINVYITIHNADREVREGAFLEAVFTTEHFENAIRVDQSVVKDNKCLMVVKDSILTCVEMKKTLKSNNEWIVEGAKQDDIIPVRLPEGTYEGMKVIPISAQK